MDNKHRQLEFEDYQAEVSNRDIFVLAEEMQLQSNTGSLFRLADAFGVNKIFLLRKEGFVLDKKITKIARSCHKYLEYKIVLTIQEVLDELPQSTEILGLEWTDSSISIFDYKSNSDKIPILIILGSERKGISPKLLAECNRVIHLPMWGKNSSMNVIQACSIFMYELRRQESLLSD